MNRKWAFLLLAAAFLGQCKQKPAAGGSPPAEDAAAVAHRVILTIGDVSLTNRDLQRFIQAQYADMFEKRNDPKLLSRLFDLFCEQQLILNKARREGFQVTDGELAEVLNEASSRGQGRAVDRDMERNSLVMQRFLLNSAYKDIDVSDAEISQYYRAHLAEYQKNEEIELFQIMTSDRERLLGIRAELLKQPARFEEFARSSSVSPEAGQGGAMGFFEKGMLPKEMEDVVFSLNVNEISPIVESPYGFHIFKVTRKRKARMQLLAAVKDEIRSKLLSAKLNAAYGVFLESLRAETPVRPAYPNLFFTYIESATGASENESKIPTGSDPDPVP